MEAVSSSDRVEGGEYMTTPSASEPARVHPSSVIERSDQRFRELVNRANFMFAHKLSGHPLFSTQSLIELAQRRPESPTYAYRSNGQVGVGDRWEKGSARALTAAETIAGIAHNDSLVMLKHLEQDVVFGPLLQQIFDELLESAGPRIRDDVIVGRGTLLIASPRRITAYHLDADVNFLFQIEGDKTMNVFDQTDRTVVTEVELERYFCGDHNGAQYTDSKQARAKCYDLRPGCGVHIPWTAPHWAQNSNNVSVALSVNFDLKSLVRLGRIYQMNGKLRQLGGNPAPPGRSMLRDSVKLASAGALTAVSGLLRRRRPPSTVSS